jgi:Uroporphyrinogen decarboxylase (URO-D)
VLVQADSGAQAVQIFDSWASHLAPQDFDVFAGPYIKRIIDDVKSTHPDLPIILYISGSGAHLLRPWSCVPHAQRLQARQHVWKALLSGCMSLQCSGAPNLSRCLAQAACWSAWQHAAQTSCQSTAAWI